MGSNAPHPSDWGEFYGRLYSRRVDLVGDYAGSEPFLVDIDSLLLRCFSDDKLDFHEGLQMLHAVWLVEYFLEGLRRRNCNFDIVFFENHAPLCVPSHANDLQRAKFLLARTVIFRHLEANLVRTRSPVCVLTFPSVTNSDFKATLSSSGYVFIMMNDGAADPCECLNHTRDKAALRLNVCSLINQGHSVALVNGLEWRDKKVIGAIIEGTAKKSPATEFNPDWTNSFTGLENDEYTTLSELQVCEVISKYHGTTKHKLSERLYLVAATIAVLLSANSMSMELAGAFLIHAALQDQLRLGCRCHQTPKYMESSQRFIGDFCKVSATMMRMPSWRAFVNTACTVCDVADLVDGRLFNTIVEDKNYQWQLNTVSSSVHQSLMFLVALITGNKLPKHGSCYQVDIQQGNSNLISPSVPYQKLLPFSEHVFDKHLEPIKLDIDESEMRRSTNESSKIFHDLTHWHNAKRPLNNKIPAAAEERHNFFERRRNQRFMAEMMAYAASLTNAIGKTLEPEVIVQKIPKASIEPHSRNEQKRVRQFGKEGGGRNKQPSKKQAFMDQIAAEKEGVDASNAFKAVKAWHTVCKDIDRISDVSTRYSKALHYLSMLQSPKRDAVRSEVEIYMLSCLLLHWKSSINNKPEFPDYDVGAKIWNSVARLKDMDGITESMALKLRETVDRLNLPFTITNATIPGRKLPFQFALGSCVAANLAISLPSREFQLLHCGLYFERKMDSVPDGRVPFLPDGWQREVLDVIDAEKSLFVVAPTSAGKTFISFYAMKKVLEASDDDVLVYVVPTKALVNQIAAEI